MAFTNVDYNKRYMQYMDSNPFQTALDEGIEKGKNLALEAMEKRKEQFISQMDDYLYSAMMPPTNAKAIHNGKLDPGFYNINKFNEGNVWAEVKKRARESGIGPHTLNKREFMEYFRGLKSKAVDKQFEMLRSYGNQEGDFKLKQILDKEDYRFADMYNKFYDPYVEGTQPLGNYKPKKPTTTLDISPGNVWNKLFGNNSVSESTSPDMLITAMQNKKGNSPSQTTTQIINNAIKDGSASYSDTADLIAFLEE